VPDRRGFRFAIEVVYLAALAAALAFTALNAVLIVAVMLAGWALITAAEWADAAARPHYAAGLPPRWRVPFVALPPAQPLEQVVAGYPEPDLEEGATWIASAAVREELLGEWPVLMDPEDTQEAAPEEWIVPLPKPLPDLEAAPEPELEPEPEPVAAEEPEPEPEPAPVVVAQAVEVRMARYHVDPFAEPERARFGRRREVPWIEVPAKPHPEAQ
jgi:hypothetical protein